MAAVMGDGGRTLCCGAFTSIGDGRIEYCKGCFEAVGWAPVEFECPEHGDRAVYSPDDGEARCVDRDEVLDLAHPEVARRIVAAAS